MPTPPSSSPLLLSSEWIQTLVRLKKFQFDAAAAHVNNENGTSATAEMIRLAFSNKESLEVERRPCASPFDSTVGTDAPSSVCSMSAHKSRCDAAFLRAAVAMSGREIELKKVDGANADAKNDDDSDAPTTPTSKTQDDIFLAEQRDRLKRRFDPDSEDSAGEVVFDDDTASMPTRSIFHEDVAQSPDGSQSADSLSRQVVLIDDTSAAEIDGVMKELGVEKEEDDEIADDVEKWVATYAD